MPWDLVHHFQVVHFQSTLPITSELWDLCESHRSLDRGGWSEPPEPMTSYAPAGNNLGFVITGLFDGASYTVLRCLTLVLEPHYVCGIFYNFNN